MTLLDGEVIFPIRPRFHRYRFEGTVQVQPYRFNGTHHAALQRVMDEFAKKSECTAETYARQFLHFDTYAERQCQTKWDDDPEKVRAAYLSYLESLGAHVTFKEETYFIRVDPLMPAPPNPRTLALQHEAISSIYKKFQELNLYPYPTSPLQRVVLPRQRRKVIQPDFDQSEGSKPNKPYDPGRIFVFEDGKWTVKDLLNNLDLGTLLRVAFERHGVSLRDVVILELLLTTGPRIKEVVLASLEAWAGKDHEGRAFHGELQLTNKGSGPYVDKTIYLPPHVVALLRRYFMEERPKYDRQADGYRQWANRRGLNPDFSPETYLPFVKEVRSTSGDSADPHARTPLFLTQRGGPMTSSGWRQVAWRPALSNAQVALSVRPHQTRHWFVTLMLLWIERQYRDHPAGRVTARKSFGKYMHWKYPEQMLEFYDHALEGADMRSQIAQLAEEMHQSLSTDNRQLLSLFNILEPGLQEARQDQEAATAFSELQSWRTDKRA